MRDKTDVRLYVRMYASFVTSQYFYVTPRVDLATPRRNAVLPSAEVMSVCLRQTMSPMS